ncbi:hypothetical protein Q427_21670 [Halomonas sp. BC04]|nr:hypothetical protein Q427_21670 [Halomonas sp. BC04]
MSEPWQLAITFLDLVVACSMSPSSPLLPTQAAVMAFSVIEGVTIRAQ